MAKTRSEIRPEIYGKIPPQSRGLEEAVLGAILLEAQAFDTVSDLLKPETFYTDAHQKIFHAIQNLTNKRQPTDMLTVVEELRKCGWIDDIGGPYAIAKLTNAVASSANIESHARAIVEKFMKREYIRIGGELITQGYDDSADVFEMQEAIESSILKVGGSAQRTDFKHISNAVTKVVKKVDELRNNPTKAIGVPTGYPELDAITYGWQAPDLIILAARPSVGKSALAANLARNAAGNSKKQVPVAVFTIEMGDDQYTQRMISAESKIWLDNIRSGSLSDHQCVQLYENGVKIISSLPIFIDDSPSLNIFQFRAKARRAVQKFGVGLIIVDYLQLMSAPSDKKGSNREQEISNISRALKATAKELRIPIIALSQLSRDIEKRAKDSREPQLSDLRESGAIEQDADVVMFIYPDFSHNVLDNPWERNLMKVKIAKNRNGPLSTISMKFYPSTQLWLTVDQAQEFENSKKPMAAGPALSLFGDGENKQPADDMPF